MYDVAVFDDLSGGITDHVKLGITNTAEELVNVLVSHEKGAKTRPGSELLSSTAYRIINGEPVRLFINFDSKLFANSGRMIYYTDSVTMSDLRGPTFNRPFDAGISSVNYSSYMQWQNHLYLVNDAFARVTKIYKDQTGTIQCRTAGLPLIDQAGITFSAPGAGKTYLYAFIYYHTYQVGTVTYVNEGPVGVFKQYDTTNAIAIADPNNITGLPVLDNSTLYNYDTTNVKIRVFRTTDTGSTFFYVGEVTNGTTTLNDVVDDATLVLNDILYTDGGNLDNDLPPPARFILTIEGTTFYLGVKEGTEIKGFRIRQSKKNNPDACPGILYKDMPKDLTGGSYIRNVPIVFAADSCWRLNGIFSDNGLDGIQYTNISATIGCVSNNSIVQLDEGLLFASNKGWAFTNGYDVTIISEHLPDLYLELIKDIDRAKQFYGTYNVKKNLVYWACQLDDTSTENDTIFVLHLYHGLKKESCFSTWNNIDFSPTALTVYNNQLIRGDDNGFIYKHDEFYRNDPKVDLTTSIAKTGLYSGIPTGCTTQVLIKADNPGSITNITLVAIPATDIDALILAWNTANPTNTITLELGDGAQIPTANIVLFGGTDAAYTAPTSWSKRNIPYDITSTELFTNSKEQEKYGAKIMTRARNIANLSLQISMANNGYKNWRLLDEIRFRGQLPWYKPYVTWETDPNNYDFDNIEDIKEMRYVPAKGSIRYYTKQVRFTPSKTVIEKSDLIGTATISTSTAEPTVTIDDQVNFKWPQYCDDYWITFEADDYTEEFLIVSRDNDYTISIIDPYGHLSTLANSKWMIKGYPKDELFELISYTLFFTGSGASYKPFKTADSGENA